MRLDFLRQHGWALATTLVFCVVIALPLLQHPKKAHLLAWDREAGRLRSFTEVAQQVRQRFPWKEPAQTAYARTRMALWGGLPRSVVRGPDGLLFYHSDTTKDGPTMADLRGEAVPPPELLEEWERRLRAQDDLLAGLGAIHLAGVLPNKERCLRAEVWPYLRGRLDAPTRADAVLPRMARCLRQPPIDLRQPFITHPDPRSLWGAQDTHWSGLGTEFAYRLVAARLAEALPGFTPLPIDAWPRVGIQRCGDLVTMARLPRFQVEEAWRWPPAALPGLLPDGSPLFPWDATPQAYDGFFMAKAQPLLEPSARELVFGNPDAPLGTLIYLGDSFTMKLAPLIGQGFRRCIARWSMNPLGRGFDPPTFERERPVLVLRLQVERYLHHLVSDRDNDPPGY